MWFLALFSVVLSGVLLALSVVPGVLDQIPGPIAVGLGGAFGLVASGAAARHLFGPARPGVPRRRGLALVVFLCLGFTPLLLLTATPRRLLFRQHQDEFEALLAQAPPPGNRVVGLNADLRLFWIDQWGTDPRGGTYFRTIAGRDDRGRADRRSYGFAHRPNDQGSPFGDGQYELQHLTGDWYSFAATDER